MIFICPHTDKSMCECRKPKNGMIEKYFSDNIKGDQNFLVGDQRKDLICAKNSFIPFILKKTKYNKDLEEHSDYAIDGLNKLGNILNDNKKNKIVALIPARKGSIGIKNKNIKLFNGHPLVAYSISAAKLIKDVSDIVVSTNCNRISRISKKYGASVPFLRPEHISGSKSTDLQFFLHYINYLKK